MTRMQGAALFQPSQEVRFQPIMLPSDQLLLLVASQFSTTLTPQAAVSRSVELAAETVLAMERGDILKAVERAKPKQDKIT